MKITPIICRPIPFVGRPEDSNKKHPNIKNNNSAIKQNRQNRF